MNYSKLFPLGVGLLCALFIVFSSFANSPESNSIDFSTTKTVLTIDSETLHVFGLKLRFVSSDGVYKTFSSFVDNHKIDIVKGPNRYIICYRGKVHYIYFKKV